MSDLGQGVAAGTGIGGLLGLITAWVGINRKQATDRARITALEKQVADDKAAVEKKLVESMTSISRAVEDFKRTTESTLLRIEGAHERHASLVVYRDTCAQCAGKQDAKLQGISDKLDFVADNLSRRRDDKKGG